MKPVLRPNRKASNEDILRYNGIGMSLSAIADKLGCHPTSVTLRLRALKVAPADTRRAFMEDIFGAMDQNLVEEVADLLMNNKNGQPKSIKAYVRELIVSDILSRRLRGQAEPPEAPENDNTPV